MRKLLLSVSVLLFVMALAAPVYAQTGYGSVVKINGNEVVVGEPGNVADSGYVYVYRPVGGTWTEVDSIVASDAADEDGFGRSIWVDGDEMLVGSAAGGGAVYRFERVDDEWNEVGMLMPFGDEDSEGFGSSMIADDDWLIVGAAGADDGWGAAYLYRNEMGNWTPGTRLVSDRGEIAAHEAAVAEAGAAADEVPDPSPEAFGTAVMVSGNWVFVGAPSAFQSSGRVYAFRNGDNGWEPSPFDVYSVPGDNFGAAMELEGDLLLIGAPTYVPLGTVRRWARDPEADQWVRIGSIFPIGGSNLTLFGSSMEIEGDTIYVATPALGSGGTVHAYQMDDLYNVYSLELISTEGVTPNDRFGAGFAVDGGTMIAGMPGADGGAGVTLFMSNAYGNWTAERVISDYKGLDPITGTTIECADGVADRFGCDNVDLLAFLPLSAIGGGRGSMTNDVWGWTDPATDNAYALVGLDDQTAFIDVTDGNNPIYIGSLPKTEGAPSASWRDIKIDENYAYIVADASPTHGMQIFNLERLREYDGEPITYDVDAHYDSISAAHNIVINEDSAFAYVVGANSGGETCGGGLHMINIEDPNNPSFAGCFADITTGNAGTGYSHDAQCVIYNGPDEQYRGHEICIGSNETAISVADVTDKRNPVALGAASYPNVAYSHQGWFTEDHKYFYMNDEGDEASGLVEGTRTLIWDLQELEDPILAGEYISDNPSIDHNLYIKGDLMFQSNYDSGLRILDISDRENIREVAHFDTVPWGEDGGGFLGTWSNYPYFDSGIIVVTSMNEGVFIVKMTDVDN